MGGGAAVEILGFEPAHAAAFHDLNVEWLDRYFRVEPIDATVLGNPHKYVIADGGQILFARLQGDIVGTVALKHHGDGVYELTKMAVTSGHRGAGIGRKLALACIEEFRAKGGRKLYLESHSSLGPALALYESLGFLHAEPPRASEYERADVYMIYQER
jgi:ribosomal protein S18 acetylase RimI-like enzyme